MTANINAIRPYGEALADMLLHLGEIQGTEPAVAAVVHILRRHLTDAAVTLNATLADLASTESEIDEAAAALAQSKSNIAHTRQFAIDLYQEQLTQLQAGIVGWRAAQRIPAPLPVEAEIAQALAQVALFTGGTPCMKR